MPGYALQQLGQTGWHVVQGDKLRRNYEIDACKQGNACDKHTQCERLLQAAMQRNAVFAPVSAAAAGAHGLARRPRRRTPWHLHTCNSRAEEQAEAANPNLGMAKSCMMKFA
jgi:hypothetical protein